MNRLKNISKFTVIIVLLVKIVFNNAALSFSTVCEFYNKDVPAIGRFFNYCNSHFLGNFWAYTGFDTGYGFFAPNVASNFIISHRITYADGHEEVKLSDFPLQTKEGKLRFTMLNQLFMDKVVKEKAKEDFFDRYMSVLLKRLNAMASRDPRVKSITTTLYLYDHMQLKNYAKGASAGPVYTMFALEEYKKNNNETNNLPGLSILY